MNVSSLPCGIEDPDDQEQVGVPGGRRHEELGRDRAGDLGLPVQRHRERHAVAHAPRTRPSPACVTGVGLSASRRGIEVELRPAGAGQRPLLLVAQHELLARVADVERHRRRLLPAVVEALQEVIEEALLQRRGRSRREQRPVRVAVDLEPLLLGRALGEAVEVAARMDALPAPVGAGEQGHRDLGEIGRARAVPGVVERMLLQLVVEVRRGSWPAPPRTA